MFALIGQLRRMTTTFDDYLAISILVAPIEEEEIQPVTASIKTLAEGKLAWEEVTNRLIEESK